VRRVVNPDKAAPSTKTPTSIGADRSDLEFSWPGFWVSIKGKCSEDCDIMDLKGFEMGNVDRCGP